MLTSGFTNAPISRFLLFGLVAASVLASITDSKYLFYINVVPHLWGYKQLWRIAAWQICYTNSSETLFAALLIYNLRTVERLWGSRKLACFILSILPYTAVLPPLILALVLRPLSLHSFNYLPAGPTAIVFALLAQFHAVIPATYKYRIVTSDPQDGIVLSDKSYTYVLATQLALSQFPHSTLPALIGWVVGYSWRGELLPGSNWRLPRWLGMDKTEADRFEGLRRRLEGEAAAQGVTSGTDVQQNPFGMQILDQIRGRF